MTEPQKLPETDPECVVGRRAITSDDLKLSVGGCNVSLDKLTFERHQKEERIYWLMQTLVTHRLHFAEYLYGGFGEELLDLLKQELNTPGI
jgi:hypothetical protein